MFTNIIIFLKVPEEPEYDPEVIANAHLTMEDDHYKCSVCKMKFKQPGNARRHIITVHRFVNLFLKERCEAGVLQLWEKYQQRFGDLDTNSVENMANKKLTQTQLLLENIC